MSNFLIIYYFGLPYCARVQHKIQFPETESEVAIAVKGGAGSFDYKCNATSYIESHANSRSV